MDDVDVSSHYTDAAMDMPSLLSVTGGSLSPVVRLKRLNLQRSVWLRLSQNDLQQHSFKMF